MGKRVRMTVQTSEKTYLSFRLETSSPGGHSSLPVKDNAIYRLAAGLTRLSRYEFPFRFNETTRGYFARMSKEEDGEVAADMRAVAQDPPNLDAAKRIADASPYHNAVLRTTCVVTRMDAGHADNALPQSARAIINCRVFPGDSLEFVRDSLIKALDDPEIQLTPLGSGQPSPVSPLLPEVMGAIERLSHEKWPSIPVLPVMDPWASDSARLRRAGIPTFGASGTFGEMDFGNAHGANERLPVDAFYDGVEFLNRLLRSMTGPFDSESPGGIHTGFTVGGIGWYRKHFALPRAWRDKVVTVRFDGAYMNADVWINGQQDKPEARQLLSSLLRYMNSDEFNPATVLDENTIQDILR